MPETHRYLIALGSNMRHHQIGSPRAVLAEAVEVLDELGLEVEAVSPIYDNPPMGASQRRFANAVLVAQSERNPPDLLELLKATERVFGRKQCGQRWRARLLDLDIILWSGGAWVSRGLTIPHPAFRERNFVLGPASSIAGDWRDPISGLTARQLYCRLRKAKKGGLNSPPPSNFLFLSAIRLRQLPCGDGGSQALPDPMQTGQVRLERVLVSAWSNSL